MNEKNISIIVSQVIEELQALAAMPLITDQDLEKVIKTSISIQQNIQAEKGVLVSVPEFIWHFLADADIRFKDSNYKTDQEAILKKQLNLWAEKAA